MSVLKLTKGSYLNVIVTRTTEMLMNVIYSPLFPLWLQILYTVLGHLSHLATFSSSVRLRQKKKENKRNAETKTLLCRLKIIIVINGSALTE
jgi:hypothetical protein